MNQLFFCTGNVLIFFLFLLQLGFGFSLPILSSGELEHSAGLDAKDRVNFRAQIENPPNAWRGLVPSQSTRADVEKLLGKPVSYRGSIVVYKTDDEEVAVVFSAGKCVLSSSERWNVPAGVVITIEIRPNKPLVIQDLPLDPKKYPRVQQSHPENWFMYRNREDGVMVETLVHENKEQIMVLTYFPSIRHKELKCTSNHDHVILRSKRRPACLSLA